MKNLKFKSLFLALSIATVSLVSCSDDDDNNETPVIADGTTVTVTNTFQGGPDGPASTGGAEVPIEQFFTDADPTALKATASVTDAVEFPSYLLGLYDIDIDGNSIDFTLVAQADDATYANFFRTIEAGSFDRYYLTFNNAHNVKSFTSSDPAVSLRVDSDNILVVQIGEGFVFQPGAAFSINVSDKEPTTPQIANGESVDIRNTFQGGPDGPASTDGAEVPIEQFFPDADPAALAATATVTDALEFSAYLLGLYDIDIDENSIDFTLVAQADDAIYANFFRTIEAGSFDRYYLTFTNAHNVKSFTSSDPAVNLRVDDSENVLVVEIGEGFVFQPGASFTINLQ